MKLTNTFSRIAIFSMRMDAGELREHLAKQLHQWHVEGTKSPGWVRSFWIQVKKLARLTGRTVEEVHRDIEEDADNIPFEEDNDRTGAKKKKNNPWAICHAQLGPEKSRRFEDCVLDIKKKNHMK